jgi:hypothetical protein
MVRILFDPQRGSIGGSYYGCTHKEVAWFAPELNRIVKHDFEQSMPSRNLLEHHVIELLSFKPTPYGAPA